MAPITDHVQLTITQTGLGITRAGFGTMLLLSPNASFPERTRTYASASEVLVDFPSTSGPEYLAAVALFSQDPAPVAMKIGRCSNKPTQKYSLTTSIANTTEYSYQVEGDGVTSTLVTYTSDADATEAEIVAGLKAAFNAVVGKNFTANDPSPAAFPLEITGNAAGNWFSIEAKNPAISAIKQTHTDPGVVADITAIAAEDDDWYAIGTVYNSLAYVSALSAHVETLKKLYIVASSDSESITTVVASGTDLLKILNGTNRKRTSGFWHASPINFADIAFMGRYLPTDPGAATGKFKTLIGVLPSKLTTTQRTNLKNRKANHYATTARRDITQEGWVVNGSFIDVTRNLDWLDDEVSKSVFELLADEDIVPFTNEGIAQVETKLRTSLSIAVERGVLVNPDVQLPLASNVSSANKTNRVLPDVGFTGELQGAIHQVLITGTISN